MDYLIVFAEQEILCSAGTVLRESFALVYPCQFHSLGTISLPRRGKIPCNMASVKTISGSINPPKGVIGDFVKIYT